MKNNIKENWMYKYNLAKAYFKHNGNLEISQSYKTLNGYEYAEEGIALGVWLNTQRQAYKGVGTCKITEEQIKLLEEIGMRFETRDNNEEWNKKYKLAKIYFEHNGNLEIPQSYKTLNGYEYAEEGIALGTWLNIQRKAYKGQGTCKISEDQIKLLEEIGMRFETNYKEEEWNKKYELAKIYFEHNRNLEIPCSYKTLNGYEYVEEGITLGTWLNTQRKAYKGQGTCKISEYQIKLLEEIGMRFETNYKEEEWNKKYELAKAYFEHNGNLEIPYNYKTLNGYEYAENGITLGIWITTQRKAYKGQGSNKITENQIKLLEEIGMRFETRDNNEEWNKKYKLAKIYFEHNGNLEIPQSYKTLNGYGYVESGIALGTWIDTQRRAYKGVGTCKITEEQIKLLEEIGMRFETRDNNEEWNKKYKLAKIYFEHNGNLEIPQSYKTLNGYEYVEEGITLGTWLNTQRQAYKGQGTCKISEDQIKLLEEIGMRFETNYKEEEWNKKYELAKAYFEHNGNLELPCSYKTLNGYEYVEEGIALGAWLNTQRQAYKGQGSNKITEEQIKLLEEIGMRFETRDNNEEWNKKYKLAKAYFEHNGNLEIPIDYKTLNGYEYTEEGIALGAWLNTQRKAYKGQGSNKITETQIKLLEEIRIKWFLKVGTDKKSQEEIITEKNSKRKQIEMLNRVRSYLNTLDESEVLSKEEINQGMIDALNHKIKRLKIKK